MSVDGGANNVSQDTHSSAPTNITDTSAWARPVQDVVDLFSKKRSAHMGATIYQAKNNGDRLAEFSAKPKYHPNHGALQLLHDKGEIIASSIKDTKRLIIVGHGKTPEKEKILLPYLTNLEEVIGIDLVPEYADSFVESIEEYKRVLNKSFNVSAKTLDVTNTHDVQTLFPEQEQTTVISTGSTVSNISYEPIQGKRIPTLEMIGFLSPLKDLAGPGGKVVIEFDTTINHDTLEEAYDDGLLAEFFRAGMRQALDSAIKVKAIRGIKISEFDDVFKFKPVFGDDPTCVYHKLLVSEPKTIEILNPNSGKYTKRRLKDPMTMMVSPKPSDNEMLGFAGHIGLEERNTVKRAAIAVQTFKNPINNISPV